MQKALDILIQILRLINELSKLVNKKLVETELFRKADDYIERVVLENYKEIIYIGSGTSQFDTQLIDRFRRGVILEVDVLQINKKIESIISEVIALLHEVYPLFLHREIGIFFAEFDHWSTLL